MAPSEAPWAATEAAALPPAGVDSLEARAAEKPSRLKSIKRFDDDIKMMNRVEQERSPLQAASYTKAGAAAPQKRLLSKAVGWLLLCIAGSSLQSCTTVPITGRTSLNFFSTQQDVELGREAYGQILEGADIVTSGSDLDTVKRVMQRLVAIADDPGYEWEVTLIRDDQVANAFALPGGKMAVYTGILPFCASEAGLAVVMGHEIAHVIAQHGTERVTRQQGLEVALQLAGAGQYESLARATTALLLDQPFGRHHESEADHIGLIYMARAGYDPREAVTFWTRMAGGEEQVAGGQTNDGVVNAVFTDFGSTHPSSGTRVARLKELMPQALAEYSKN